MAIRMLRLFGACGASSGKEVCEETLFRLFLHRDPILLQVFWLDSLRFLLSRMLDFAYRVSFLFFRQTAFNGFSRILS